MSEYTRLLYGEFTVTQREQELHERWEQYYRDTPDSMSNKEALKYRRKLKEWCDQRGYTLEETSRVKRNISAIQSRRRQR